jgi:hypothetical protein
LRPTSKDTMTNSRPLRKVPLGALPQFRQV